MNGAPESHTAASASPLVGPYPIDEDALRKLKRSHDDGVIDDDDGIQSLDDEPMDRDDGDA